MKKNIYKISKIWIVACVMAGMVSCDSWLDLDPQNKQMASKYWKKQADVEAVLMSCYTRMRNCVELFFQWGELRGDGIILASKATNDEKKIEEIDILPENTIAKWEKVYAVIGSANAVIKYGPETYQRDPQFELPVLNAMVAEATFIRSLCYFYLVRTFGDVPFVTEPYVDDSQSFKMGKTAGSEILDVIVQDLKDNIKYSKPGHELEADDKSRGTRWSVYALLADIYLWQEKYQDCIDMCDLIFASEKFAFLEEADNWFQIFNPQIGFENKEIIFEILFTSSYTLDWYKYFKSGDVRYTISNVTQELYKEVVGVNDIRGAGASYQVETNLIWKYIGAVAGEASIRPNNDANWIFYRYSDIMLMKAEALAMDERDLPGAIELVNRIRTRAGYLVDLPTPASEREALEIIMDERGRELFAEGKRWFDIMRMGKKRNFEYKDYLIGRVLLTATAGDRPIIESKLQNPLSWYLPIYQKEIEDNTGLLEQNEYYKNDNL